MGGAGASGTASGAMRATRAIPGARRTRQTETVQDSRAKELAGFTRSTRIAATLHLRLRAGEQSTKNLGWSGTDGVKLDGVGSSCSPATGGSNINLLSPMDPSRSRRQAYDSVDMRSLKAISRPSSLDEVPTSRSSLWFCKCCCSFLLVILFFGAFPSFGALICIVVREDAPGSCDRIVCRRRIRDPDEPKPDGGFEFRSFTTIADHLRRHS